ncbi:MAG: hypothetical protein ACE5KE_15945, partial [Methanosarcinales archaeon]
IGGFEVDHLYSSKDYRTDHIHFNFIIPCVGVDKKKNQLVFLKPYIGDSYTIDIEELKKQYGEYLSKRYGLNIEKVVMNIVFVKDKKLKKRGVKVLHHRIRYFLRSYNPEFFVYDNGSLSYVDKKSDIYMENLSDDDFVKILNQFIQRGKLGKKKERVGSIKRYSWFGYLADNVWGDYKKLFGIGDEVKKGVKCGKCNAKMMYAGSDYKGKIVTTSRWLLENDLYDLFKKWIDDGMNTTREGQLPLPEGRSL